MADIELTSFFDGPDALVPDAKPDWDKVNAEVGSILRDSWDDVVKQARIRSIEIARAEMLAIFDRLMAEQLRDFEADA